MYNDRTNWIIQTNSVITVSIVAIVKRSDCILVYGSATKGGVVKRFDYILVYGSTTKGGVVKGSDCILVYGSTTKGDDGSHCTYCTVCVCTGLTRHATKCYKTIETGYVGLSRHGT